MCSFTHYKNTRTVISKPGLWSSLYILLTMTVAMKHHFQMNKKTLSWASREWRLWMNEASQRAVFTSTFSHHCFWHLVFSRHHAGCHQWNGICVNVVPSLPWIMWSLCVHPTAKPVMKTVSEQGRVWIYGLVGLQEAQRSRLYSLDHLAWGNMSVQMQFFLPSRMQSEY